MVAHREGFRNGRVESRHPSVFAPRRTDECVRPYTGSHSLLRRFVTSILCIGLALDLGGKSSYFATDCAAGSANLLMACQPWLRHCQSPDLVVLHQNL